MPATVGHRGGVSGSATGRSSGCSAQLGIGGGRSKLSDLHGGQAIDLGAGREARALLDDRAGAHHAVAPSSLPSQTIAPGSTMERRRCDSRGSWRRGRR